MGLGIRSWLSRTCVQPMILKGVRVAAAAIHRYSLDAAAAEIFDRHSYHLLKKHYYLPIPAAEDLGEAFWNKRSEMVGVDMNDAFTLRCLREVFPVYVPEFRKDLPLSQRSSDNPDQFFLINGTFMAIDAHVYYCLIRHHKPRRIVEIGAGNSTLVAAAACTRNRDEGAEVSLTAIDPYPSAAFERDLPSVSRLIKDKVQNIDMDLFETLGKGDILFIDSTHVLREGGDVQLEYCELLPRLAPGVLVHIHDISLPKAYPRVYFENHLYWNEQYLLQAFLTNNSRFEVVWPGNYMMLNYPKEVCAVFPEYHAMRESYPMSEPSSFWMQVRYGENS